MARELDFWAERSNGQQFGIIVFDARPKLTEDQLRRSIEASKMPVEVWLNADLAQRRQLLRNLKQLRPYVSQDEPVSREIQENVQDFLRKYQEGSWGQIKVAVRSESSSMFTRAVSLLYHSGKIDLDISARPLSKATWIKIR
jgi:hypothetical protein